MKKSLFLFLCIVILTGCSNTKPYVTNSLEKIYYLSNKNNTTTIFTLDTTTKTPKEINIGGLSGNVKVSLPVYSNSSKHFYALIENNTGTDIFSFDVDGNILRNITNSPEVKEGYPILSADGKWIAFERFDYKSDIWVMDINGNNLKNLTEQYPDNYSPLWSIDNSKIYFSSLKNGTPNIYSVTLKGELTNLSNGQGVDGTFSVSSDEKYMVFDSDREGNSDIFLLDLNTKEIKNLTKSKNRESQPLFSPDGKKILFKSFYDKGFDYKIILLDTMEVISITDSPEQYKENACWSNDSTKIFFNMEVNNQMDIYSVNIYNNELINLTHTEDANEYSPHLVNFPTR